LHTVNFQTILDLLAVRLSGESYEHSTIPGKWCVQGLWKRRNTFTTILIWKITLYSAPTPGSEK